ncbi:MAG TPA: GNAT family N-acetyltransferase [Candidatus Saccharimonadia bacterium]|nr:GNAT family N-acetyltransferase [Candidatus Saccharimonadia bacterium]
MIPQHRSDAFRIEYLAAHPEHVAPLATLHHAQWHAMLPGWTYATAFAELASHREGPAIPTTVVALAGDSLLGSCSLLADDHDHDATRAYSPWLASLFVLGPYRRQGIGRALTARIVADAAALGVGTLYLYTHDAPGYYAALGWREHAKYRFGAFEVDVMAIATDAGRIAQDAAARTAHA